MTQTPSVQPIRFAIVHVPNDEAGQKRVAAYLPSNYRISPTLSTFDTAIVIEGTDNAGWTLEDYVIPRLASGLITAQEVPVKEGTVQTVTKVTLFGPAPTGGTYTSVATDPKVMELILQGWTVHREWQVVAEPA